MAQIVRIQSKMQHKPVYCLDKYSIKSGIQLQYYTIYFKSATQTSV